MYLYTILHLYHHVPQTFLTPQGVSWPVKIIEWERPRKVRIRHDKNCCLEVLNLILVKTPQMAILLRIMGFPPFTCHSKRVSFNFCLCLCTWRTCFIRKGARCSHIGSRCVCYPSVAHLALLVLGFIDWVFQTSLSLQYGAVNQHLLDVHQEASRIITFWLRVEI